jgi:hypothetical protein
MITYVNTVFVSNYAGSTLATSLTSGSKGQFIVWDIDQNKKADNTSARFRIGMFTGKTSKQVNPNTGATTDVPDIKWSNVINVADIKGWTKENVPSGTPVSEDQVTIDLHSLDSTLLAKFAEGGKRIIVRLTFKDMPHRYRKWTESYEYVTVGGDTKATIATAIANMINKEWKRARVSAAATTTSGSEKIVITALPYDDDDSVDSLNWYNKVRFNANVYYTDPAAEGWESLNKHFIKGVNITKVPGKTYVGYGKLVRDREAQSMGYVGILNHGEGTWPIIQPAMETDIQANYNVITLEFENMYRTADDLWRRTKQTVEIYSKTAQSAIIGILEGENAITPQVDNTKE